MTTAEYYKLTDEFSETSIEWSNYLDRLSCSFVDGQLFKDGKVFTGERTELDALKAKLDNLKDQWHKVAGGGVVLLED